MQKRLFIGLAFGVLMMHAGTVCAEEQVLSKGLRWFYRMAYRLDNFLLQGVDTNYITLPEHSWRLAYTTSMVGINSMLMDDVSRMVTHQVAVGIGYGINYTPNKGKVILHLSANAELVCYSIDPVVPRKSRLQKWVTDYFYSPLI